MTGTVTASLWPDRSKQRRDEEERLHRAVVQYLTWALPNDAVAYHPANGGLRSIAAARRLKGMGVKAGVPDIAIVWRGHALFIELKATSGSLSEAQRLMHRQLTYCGADVVTCRTLPCVETSLRELGVPLRGSVMA